MSCPSLGLGRPPHPRGDRSPRVLFDRAGFATETDRATDVVDPASFPQGEHFIASKRVPN